MTQQEPLDGVLAPGPWMAPSEAARHAGVSVQRINALVDQQRLRVVRTPLGRLIRRDDVEAYRLARATRANGRDDSDPRPAA